MIDIELVKLRYERMEDAELISLTENSWYALNPEAITALYQEFLKRKLDISIFPYLRRIQWQNNKIARARSIEAENKKYETYLKNACIKDLSEGKSFSTIFKKLQRTGLRNKECLHIIYSLRKDAKDQKNEYDTHILTGICIALPGIFINSLISITSTTTSSNSIGWLLIATGIIKIVLGFSNKWGKNNLSHIIDEIDKKHNASKHHKSAQT
jgi:uncharacterized membrane protein